MLPVIAIVGRPNVGKSTLFNRLTRSRDAIVADCPGVTRDRQYGDGLYLDKNFIVIDTGGIGVFENEIDEPMLAQSKLAIEEADVVFFVVDGKSGLTAADKEISAYLRPLKKSIHLVVNKTDGLMPEIAMADFYELGFGLIYPISATHGHGIEQLIAAALESEDCSNYHQEKLLQEDAIYLAFVGKPNVGKSTLINRLLGEERVVVFDQPGTTRDSIYIPFKRAQQDYVFIDTAGIRRRKNVIQALEKFSIIKTLRAISLAHVVVMVIDARENISEQDLRLLSYIIEKGKGLIIAVNKWDDMPEEDKKQIKSEIDRRLQFVDFAKFHFISALHGSGVGNLYSSIEEAYRCANIKVSTHKLTALLQEAVQQHQPPLIQGRRVKLRFAHLGGHNPPVIIIHGNQTDKIDEAYKRYLNNFFRKRLKLVGTPLKLECKSGENPFQHIRNKLTPRQEYKRRRLLKFIKKSK